MPFIKGKWIWLAEGERADQYAEFKDSFVYGGGEVVCYISSDTDYTLWVNGKYVTSGQYGDYEHYKIYDTVDLTELLRLGENELKLTVHHVGVKTSRYRPASAGLIYEIRSGDEVLAYSSESTPSRLSPNYKSGEQVFVSVQLGFTFSYDASGKSAAAYSPSVTVDKKCAFFKRPIKKQMLLPPRRPASIKMLGSTHYLIDLGGETVGLPRLELVSPSEQTVTVAFGEHIKDGCVRARIGARSFFYKYKTSVGYNLFTEYMLRLGCRYLEVFSEEPIELIYAGVIPQVYRVEELPCVIDNALERRIYDACVNTLKLCMMEHYVDCPWREQALYACDSRNQMLCGYYAFEGGNAEYARSNLKLISEDRRDDGLLSITYPTGEALSIPCFSLHYINAMREYLEHTDDATLSAEYLPKMIGIIEEHLKNSDDGLGRSFSGDAMWNFYDWSEYSNLGKGGEPVPDLAQSSLLVMAIDSLESICRAVGADFPYIGLTDKMRRRIREEFFTDGIFTMRKGKEEFTILGNSLAILAGAVSGGEAEYICESIVAGGLSDCSLSMKIVEYEALLSVNKERYREFVLGEIRMNYSIMLDAGSDTVWETVGGADDFSGAGSLCHGWSAIPVYFYHRLGVARRQTA